MPFIGNQPAESYASFETETFSVSATTNYTLSHAVTNENEIRLVINGVVQQPGSGKAYTASGTTLTLSSATASGDSMYAVYLGRALQTVNPPNASVGNSQTAPTIITGQTAETSIATDDTILIHDTSASALRKMTRANFVSGIGGTNTPYFFAYRSSNTNISASTWTVVVFNAESLDSGSGFNTTTGIYTVPSGQGGKYYLEHEVRIEASTSQVDRIYTYGETGVGTTQYWGNGGLDFRGNPGQGGSVGGSRILTLAAGDTAKVNIYAGLNTGTPTVLGGSEGYTSYFLGYKIIE